MQKSFTVAAAALAASVALGTVAPAGTVAGTVKYGGTAPAPKKIEKTKDTEICGKVSNTSEELVVGPGSRVPPHGRDAAVLLRELQESFLPARPRRGGGVRELVVPVMPPGIRCGHRVLVVEPLVKPLRQ